MDFFLMFYYVTLSKLQHFTQMFILFKYELLALSYGQVIYPSPKSSTKLSLVTLCQLIWGGEVSKGALFGRRE